MLRGRFAAAGLTLVLAGACGGGGESASPSSQASPTTAAPATGAPPASGTSPVRTTVPDVVLRDVATGADVNLRGAAARPDRPTLYWFWAPH